MSNAGDTGINPWWTYEEDTVAGVGRAMVNVGNGNFLLQADDVDIRERGIDLAFRRTYNSMSGHDVNGSDGSGPSLFGNKWTSTFDAHLAYNSTTNVLTVYDIDGASYPYTANAGAWVPPAGVHTTLTSDGSCGYYWTKKTGTSYHFYAPYATSCGYPAGTYGRITQIYARNNNSVINFTYSWGGAGSSLEQLTQLVVAHSDGQTLTLNFSAFGSYTELSSIVRPDGSEVTYSYDTSGNLLEVDRPGNSTISVLPETYAYSTDASGPTMSIYSPRATLASRQNTQDGAYYTVQFDVSNHAIGAYKTGLYNPTPNDGTNTALQSGAAWRVIDDQTFAGFGTATTSYSDTDGHANSYIVDTLGRVTQKSEWNGSVWLVSNETWDVNNNLVESADERGNATDYAYDSNGNTIAEALPQVSTSLGTFRPTKLYSYDSYNNVVAYCDPNYTNSLGKNWVSAPSNSDSLCPLSSGAYQFSFAYPSYEYFGELTAMVSPLGYTRQIAYAAVSQGGTDFGLPTSVTGSTITQADGTARTPTETFTYDGNGNTVCYGNGTGTYAMKFDSLNRQTVVADPDDGSVSQCSKPSTSYRTASYTSYNPDGTVSLSSTPPQYAASAGTTNTFDADGDKVTEKVYFAAGTSVTHTNWYDGDDRLIEVDNGSTTSAGWLTRYLYDLSLGQGVSLLATGTFYAHGNLYGTETGGPTWLEQKGTAYDALNREVSNYRWPMNCLESCTSVAKTAKHYDSSAATLGLLSSRTNEVGGTATYAYDSAGRETSVSYSGDGGVTPNESMTYDADGHVVATTSSVFGAMSDTYDADGRLTKRIEPSGGGVSSPATLTYDYYGDGMKKDIGVSSSALTKLPLFQYSYRTDGERQTLSAFPPAGSTKYQWIQTAGGRYTSQVVNGSTTVTQTYDTYGQATARTVPSTSAYYAASSATYDLQGDLLSVYLGGTGGVTQTSTYDQLSEIAGTTPSALTSVACGVSQVCPYISRGYQRGGQQFIKTQTTTGGHSTTVLKTNTNDLRSGAILGYSTTPSYAPATPNPGCGGAVIDARKYTYDAGGRETAGSWSWANTLALGKTCTYQTGTGTMSQTFDTEERMVSHTETNWELDAVASKSTTPFTWTFGYGPNDHVALATTSAPGATSGSTTLHWDGNNLLFTSNSTGISVYIDGALGQDAVANDFDIAGYTKSTEGYALNFLSFPINATRDPYQFYPGAYPEGFSYTAPGTITDTINTFQGVRQLDNVTGQWITPDPYSGRVEDPMTQRPYMWNNNNPVSYSDPTGYDPLLGQEIPFGAIQEFLEGASREGLDVKRADAMERIGRRVLDGKYPTNKKGSSNKEDAGKPFTSGQRKDSSTKPCDACGKEPSETGKPTQPDHIVPKSKGGDNSEENRNNLCGRFCNPSKGASTPEEWLDRLFRGVKNPDPIPPLALLNNTNVVSRFWQRFDGELIVG